MQIRPPEGFDVTGIAASAPTTPVTGSRFVAWSGGSRASADHFDLEYEFSRTAGRFEARDYGEYYSDVERALGFFDQGVQFKRSGAMER